MKQTVCDLCKEPIFDCDEDRCKWKIKRYSPFKKEWIDLDAHPGCVEAVASAAREREEKDGCL